MVRSQPKRGEVWLVDLGYTGKRRPCLILNIDLSDEDRVIVACVPHTTSIYGTRFEVKIESPFLDETGVFDAQGLIPAKAVKCERRLGILTNEQLFSVELAVKLWLGFENR